MFKAEIQGLDSLLKKIEKFDKSISDAIDKSLTKSANNIVVHAQLLAPSGKSGRLGASIIANTVIKFNKSVEVGAPYAAYVEFGTGKFVFKSLGYAFTPAEKVYARQFFITGKGTMVSRPFLFPSLFKEKEVLLKDIKQILFKSLE